MKSIKKKEKQSRINPCILTFCYSLYMHVRKNFYYHAGKLKVIYLCVMQNLGFRKQLITQNRKQSCHDKSMTSIRGLKIV